MKTKRLYINLTNKCNRKCPFCLMWSGPNNNIFMDQVTYKNIITGYNIDNEPFEVQLGGGEPLIHPSFLDYVEFACQQPLIDKIIIITNGIATDSCIEQLYNLSKQYQKQIIFKISINYYLIETNPEHLKQIQNWSKKYPNSDYWLMCLSIRCREPQSLESEWMIELEHNSYFNLPYNMHFIHFEGRAKQNKVKGTVLTNYRGTRICVPFNYASDGTFFGKDFAALKDYERKLSNEQ